MDMASVIHEELLLRPPAVRRKDRIHEKMLRPIAAEVDWAKQGEMWERLRSI